MAIIDCHYQCGCGFTTTEPLKALDHVNDTKHTLTVQGVIKPGTPGASPTTVSKPRAGAQQVAETPTVDTQSYDKLRQMILAQQRSQENE